VVEPTYETILIEVADGVATITLNRPDSLNALNGDMRRELLSALKVAGRDEAVAWMRVSAPAGR